MLLGGNPDEKSVMTYVVNFLVYEQENRDLVDRVQRLPVCVGVLRSTALHRAAGPDDHDGR